MHLKDGYFDRVLCDVPCSGDGTLRKNPAIWSKWSTSSGFVLHPLQLIIACRGLQLLRAGGLMVYSTCSLSPYENEAVVAELLRQNKGTLELVDGREFLPLFKARRGLSSWQVLDDQPAIRKENQAKRDKQKQPQSASSSSSANQPSGETTAEVTTEPIPSIPLVDEVPPAEESKATNSNPRLQDCLDLGMAHFASYSDVPESLRSKIRRSLFPPSEEERQWMQLEKCLRCVPHDEDTGGFFVCTFRKLVKPVHASSSSSLAGTATPVTVEEPAAPLDDAGVDDETAAAAMAVEANEEELVADDKDTVEVGDKRSIAAVADDENAGQGKSKKRQMTERGLVEYKPWDQESFDKVACYLLCS